MVEIMGFDAGRSWVLTTVEIDVGFDEISMGVTTVEMGGELGGLGFDFAMNFEF